MADVTDATFEADVLQRSQEVPVVVDLWAPWCGPCRTLGPVLEDVVGATEGKVELVKVNVDENPQISAAFRVQSIPAVYALKDGKVVDGFIGAQPKPAWESLSGACCPARRRPRSTAWCRPATSPRSGGPSTSTPTTPERWWRWPSCSWRRAGARRRCRSWPASPSRPRPDGWRPRPGSGPSRATSLPRGRATT